MTPNTFNDQDPDEWIQEQQKTRYEDFRDNQVVGEHCESCQYDPDPVIKRGTAEADLMVVGSQVSSEDHRTEVPFSGPAGDLLKDMLEAIDRDWEEDCYLTNSLLCNTGSGSPKKSSLEACYTNLSQQLDIVSPEVVLLLGKNACQSALQLASTISLEDYLGEQGTLPDFPWIEVVVSFNPAYILRHEDNPNELKKLKKVAWEHLKIVREKLDEEPDEN